MQYGLASLKSGQITPAEFLHVNWHIGGWKHPSDMVQETFPFFGTSASEVNKALTIPGYFDPWSRKSRFATSAISRRTLSPVGQGPAYQRGGLARRRCSVAGR